MDRDAGPLPGSIPPQRLAHIVRDLLEKASARHTVQALLHGLCIAATAHTNAVSLGPQRGTKEIVANVRCLRMVASVRAFIHGGKPGRQSGSLS